MQDSKDLAKRAAAAARKRANDAAKLVGLRRGSKREGAETGRGDREKLK